MAARGCLEVNSSSAQRAWRRHGQRTLLLPNVRTRIEARVETVASGQGEQNSESGSADHVGNLLKRTPEPPTSMITIDPRAALALDQR